MGTWGTSLYSNDTTSDVRDLYIGYLKGQMSNEEAFEKIITEFNELMGDEDEEPLFWFALAETQWKVGRLTPEVKEKALKWIKKNGAVKLWEESGVSSEGWKKTLKELKETLESPMRSEKKFQKPRQINRNFWNIGDVYAYQLHREKAKENGIDGKYILIQKVGEGKYVSKWAMPEENELEPLLMRISMFDKLFDEMPTLKDLETVSLLPMSARRANGDIAMNGLVDFSKKKDYPKDYLFYLGNTTVVESEVLDDEFIIPALWVYLDAMFIQFSNEVI